MSTYQADEIDRELLALLQEDARYAATELAEQLGVSDNTVHNRMARLEEEGVITGYTATVDNERVGYGLYFSFICTARISDREEVAEQALEIPAVTEVTELMTGQRNLHIKVYGSVDEDITEIAHQLDQLELEINDENLIKSERRTPLDYERLTVVEE